MAVLARVLDALGKQLRMQSKTHEYGSLYAKVGTWPEAALLHCQRRPSRHSLGDLAAGGLGSA